ASDPSEPALREYDPEFSNNYELGIKNEYLDNRLRRNLSVYYTTVDNVQIHQLILPDAVVVTTNEGEMRSMGLESELTALIGNNLTMGWNGGITDAEFTALMVAGEGDNADHTGNKQLFSPDFTSNLSVEYNKLMRISGKYE